MSAPNARRRPAADGTATMVQELAGSLTIVPPVMDNSQVPALSTAAEEGWVVLVRTGEQRTRRRAYFTVAAAERAVQRARARGLEATAVLCSFAPVEVQG